MDMELFDKFKFNVGWKTIKTIELFNKKYEIIVKLAAYFEEDGITDEQKKSYKSFLDNENKILSDVNEKLLEYDLEAENKFVPTLLLVNRDGELALMLDDDTDFESGIVVCIYPEIEILLQDDYL